MSSEWTIQRLDDLAEKVAMGPFGSSIKVETFTPNGIPIISGQHLHDISLTEDSFRFISEAHATKLKNANVYRGDVIFTHAGTIGQVSYIPENSCYERYIISQRQFYLRCNQKKILPQFVVYFFKSPVGRHKLLANASQVGVPSIARPTTNIRSIEMPVPPIREQEKIIEVIGSLGDRIALLRETNTKLEAIAQAIFKSWFVDFDPVRAKQQGREPEGMDVDTAALFPDSFDESALGLVPRGWHASTLGSICAENAGAIQTGPFGSQLHASDYLDAGIPVVMPQDLGGRRVQIEKIARVGDADANRLHRHRLRLNDIVFSRRGDVGRHAFIGQREAGWLCGTGCLLVRPGDTWPSGIYLSLALDRTDAKEWLLRHAVGATMPNLNTGILSAVPIMRPDFHVLRAFDNVVSVLDDGISNNHSKIRSLSELRDTLLPRLISGQLRLPETEALVKEAA